MKVEPIPEGLRIELADEGETRRLGQALATLVEPETVIGLVGPLGAGKTRLTRAIAEGLGVESAAIASPTFVLHHVYEGTELTVHHFDVYRLGTVEEFEALGVTELFGEGAVCLMEWADRVKAVLPSSCWWITLEMGTGDGDTRRAALRVPGKVAEALARAL